MSWADASHEAETFRSPVILSLFCINGDDAGQTDKQKMKRKKMRGLKVRRLHDLPQPDMRTGISPSCHKQEKKVQMEERERE